MPTFFNPSELTIEQKSRWDFACAEYKRTLERNLETRFARLSESDRVYFAKECGITEDADIKEEMRSSMELNANAPGHPKSALFARLLDGKQALPYPPPTCYSYPWYSIIEEDIAQSVRIGGALTLGALINGTGGAGGVTALSLNQCQWSVVSKNEEAEQLFGLQSELDGLKQADPKRPDENISLWTPDLYERVKAVYAKNPEFVVKFGHWPEYRLFVMHHADRESGPRGQRSYAQAVTDCVELRHTHSVFEMDSLKINVRIGKVLDKAANPHKRLADAKARVAKLQESDQSLMATLDRSGLAQQLASLEQDVREFEANPAAFDWVEFSYDRWFLERAA